MHRFAYVMPPTNANAATCIDHDIVGFPCNYDRCNKMDKMTINKHVQWAARVAFKFLSASLGLIKKEKIGHNLAEPA